MYYAAHFTNQSVCVHVVPVQNILIFYSIAQHCVSHLYSCAYGHSDVRSSRVHNPNGISIDSAVFAWLTIVKDRQTDRRRDHATPSVTIGRISVRSSLPFHQIDIIGAMVIVWRVSAKIIRSVLCSVVCNNNCEQRNVHTYEQA